MPEKDEVIAAALESAWRVGQGDDDRY